MFIMLSLRMNLLSSLVCLVIISSSIITDCTFAQSLTPNSNIEELTFIVRVTENTTAHRPVKGLKSTDFQIRRGSHFFNLTEVTEVQSPLAISLVINLGNNGKCGFDSFSDFIEKLKTGLEKTLRQDDQLALFVTNAQGQSLFKFDEKYPRPLSIFDLSTEVELNNISDQNSFTCRAVKRQGSWADAGNELGGDYNVSSVSISFRNYLGTTLKNAIGHLHSARRSGTRPIIIIANDIYNLVDFNENDEKEILNRLQTDNIVVHWLGRPSGVAGCCYFILDAACIDKPHKRTKFFKELPKVTGGKELSCDIFRSYDNAGYTRDADKNITKSLASLFEQERHSYALKAYTEVQSGISANSTTDITVKKKGVSVTKLSADNIIPAKK